MSRDREEEWRKRGPTFNLPSSSERNRRGGKKEKKLRLPLRFAGGNGKGSTIKKKERAIRSEIALALGEKRKKKKRVLIRHPLTSREKNKRRSSQQKREKRGGRIDLYDPSLLGEGEKRGEKKGGRRPFPYCIS